MKTLYNNAHSPRLSSEEVVRIAESTLREVSSPFDLDKGFSAQWRGEDWNVPGHEGRPLRVWSVAYQTPGDFFDPEPRFLDIDDDTGIPLYIMTGTGHIPLV